MVLGNGGDARWRAFYERAQQQDVIDPAMLTAIAISESGPSKYGLGIDSNGTPGLPGTAGGDGNATHRFYTYVDGLQAAQGLAAYLQTPLYRDDEGILGKGPERMLASMVLHSYSGCARGTRSGGGECDPNWDFEILQLRTQVIATFGAPTNPDRPGAPPPPGPGAPGTSPPPATNPPASGDDPCANTGVIKIGPWETTGLQPIAIAFCHLGRMLQFFTHPGTWWAVLLFVAALAAIVGGVFLYFKSPAGQQTIKAVAAA